jgi:lysophospholipase L1-like esterase
MGTARRLAARLAAAVAGVLLALLVAEILLRALAPTPTTELLRGLHVARPERGWLYGLVPGVERTSADGSVVYAVNRDGFRDGDYARSKPEGTFRTIALGDSIAFGYGVALEASFVKQLERHLRAGAVRPLFEVLNLGVSGYNPYTEAELLDDVGIGYQPDLVLVQFCVNDLNDPTLHFDSQTMLELGAIPDAAFPDPASRRKPVAPSWTDGLTRTCRSSRLCTLIEDVVAPASHDELVRALAPHDQPSPREIAWLQAIYERMMRRAREHGAAFVLIVFPYQGQLAAEAPSTLQSALNALGARAGFPVIDLLPAFRKAAADSDAPLFLDIWHPTERGQTVAADEIFHQLACKGLLPGVTERCAAP